MDVLINKVYSKSMALGDVQPQMKALTSRATEAYPFTGMDAIDKKEYLSAKRSLLYVAITRARQLVFMVGSGEVTGLLQLG